MSIYVGDKKAKLYHGDCGPAQFYKGDMKIAGYTDGEKVGTAISGTDAYNDRLNPTIVGKSEQTVTANAPSPDYPSPVRSSENFDVVSCGRNLFDEAYLLDKKNWIYQKDITYAVKLTLKPNTKYTFMRGSVHGSYPYPIYQEYCILGINTTVNIDTNFICNHSMESRNNRYITFTTPATGVMYLNSTSAQGINEAFRVAKIYLEGSYLCEGAYTADTLPTYEPYHATTAHITDPLRSVGDVSDSIEVSEGKVEVVRRVVRVAITSSSIIAEHTEVYHRGYTHFRVYGGTWSVLACMCNILPYVQYSWVIAKSGISPSGLNSYPTFSNVTLGISDTDTPEQKVSKLKAWLKTHEMYADFLPNAHTRTDITATPLGQSLLALRTYPNYTQVFTNAALPPTLRAHIKEMERE